MQNSMQFKYALHKFSENSIEFPLFLDTKLKAIIFLEGCMPFSKPVYVIPSKCKHNIIAMEGIKPIFKLMHANSIYTTTNNWFPNITFSLCLVGVI